MNKKYYESELERLQTELNKLQRWIRQNELKVLVIFEGRDAAGKGGTIKRISSVLNPRICRVVALPKPSDRERTQWYFQRYVQHLPAAGELVLFDRSWYNRAGVERVMGFCSELEVEEFLHMAPLFESMLTRSGIILIKYWFSVSSDEQERRFQDRLHDPTKTWKISPIDIASRAKWEEYSYAKDEMFRHTDRPGHRWNVVPADNKRSARLNCIHHLLSSIPYEEIPPAVTSLPPRPPASFSKRSPMDEQLFVPAIYS